MEKHNADICTLRLKLYIFASKRVHALLHIFLNIDWHFWTWFLVARISALI